MSCHHLIRLKGYIRRAGGVLQQGISELDFDFRGYANQFFEKLSAREKSLHEKAFCTNTGDLDYRQLIELKYKDGANERRPDTKFNVIVHADSIISVLAEGEGFEPPKAVTP